MKIIVAARWTGASNALAPNYIVVEASGTVEAEIGRGEQYRGKAGMSRTAAPYENSREFASRTGFLGNMSDFRDSSTGFFFAAFGAAIRCSSEFREIPAKFSENWRKKLRKSAAFRKIPPHFAVAVQKFTKFQHRKIRREYRNRKKKCRIRISFQKSALIQPKTRVRKSRILQYSTVFAEPNRREHQVNLVTKLPVAVPAAIKRAITRAAPRPAAQPSRLRAGSPAGSARGPGRPGPARAPRSR